MAEINKRVDESWKEQVEQEKQKVGPEPSGQPAPAAPAAAQPGPPPQAGGRSQQEAPEARFDLFLSGLAMDALIALGEMANPATRRQSVNLEHARYLIDLLGVIEEKTKGNLSADEDRLMKDALYQLRMRYLAKSGGAKAA